MKVNIDKSLFINVAVTLQSMEISTINMFKGGKE
jgi:hypothetical protein